MQLIQLQCTTDIVATLGHPFLATMVYSRYSGHVYSGHSDKVATFPTTKYMYSYIFRSDIVANRI